MVTQVEPISVIFTLPETNLPQIQQHLANGALKVEAYSQDNTIKLDEGSLDFIDNEIVQTTGSVRLRANFPNKEHRLWPGQLVNAWLLLDTRPSGLTVSAPAVQQGAQGAYVYVINADSTVAVRPVKVAQVSGGQALIDFGLSAGEQVVVDGQYKLQPGMRVSHPAWQGGRRGGSAGRPADANSMNISAPFIVRPIATALLMVGLLLGGLAAYPLLPIAALPNVSYPTLQITAQLPGADPQTMASSVTTPLETQFGQIPGLTQMTSASSLGYTQITLQFDLSRGIDGCVSDTLSAINAASAYLPPQMPYPPRSAK